MIAYFSMNEINELNLQEYRDREFFENFTDLSIS